MLLNRANINITLHPHGVRYDKASEGSPYEDGTEPALRLDDEVRPGQTYTYIWTVSTAVAVLQPLGTCPPISLLALAGRGHCSCGGYQLHMMIVLR